MTDERAAVELKGCPACGSSASIKSEEDYFSRDWWYGTCEVCCFRTSLSATRREAADDWNTRPIEDTLRAENTELSARVSELTRLLAEAEEKLWQARFAMFNANDALESDGDIDKRRAAFEWIQDLFDGISDEEYQRAATRFAKRPVQRALQSDEGGK